MSEHELWNELGNLYFMSGAYEPAIYAYIRSINLDPGFGRPYSNLALAYVVKRRYTEAVELFRKSIDLLVDTREKVITMNRLGNAYRQIKDYKNAVAIYQKADEIDPTFSDIQEDSVQDAQIPLTLSMPALDLKTAPLIQRFGMEDQLSTLNLDSDQIPIQTDEAYELTADMLHPLPETSEIPESDDMETDETLAMDVSDWFILPPDPVETNEPQCRLDNVEAHIAGINGVSNFSRAETIEPAKSMELDNQTLTETESVQYTQADYPLIELSDGEIAAIENDIAKFTRVVNINPRNGMAWYTLGNLYKSMGRYKEAISSYKQAIASDSTKAPYYYHLGLVLAAEKMHEDAIKSFLKVIEIDPNYSLAHATLGGHYRKLGLEDLAQYHIKKALGKAFMDENEYNRACLEAICGNTDNAIDLLQVALSNKQTYVEWARRDPDLDFLRDDPRFQALIGQSHKD
jgi:tetratricopeptide (TPR) repeat protein